MKDKDQASIVEPTKGEDRGASRWLVLIVISLALFMSLLDVTIVNIAIPHIMSALNAGLSSIEWVINVYILIMAISLLTLGKLGDLFGRKRLFLIGLAVFTLASLGCSLSPNLAILLVSRGIQAIGGAAMMPATLSIINVEFGKYEIGLAIGIWGAISGAANAAGPIIGGALVDAFSWRYIFLINVPIGIVAIVAGILIVRESKDTATDRHIDVPGIISVSIALFCLTFALVEGQKYGWTSMLILSLFVISLVTFIVFIFIEPRTKNPLMQLRLFRSRNFSGGNAVSMVVMLGLVAVIFMLTLFLQIVLGFSAFKAGLTLLPLPLALMLVAPIAGRLTDKIGGRWILFGGTLLAAVGVYYVSQMTGINTTWVDMVLPLAICGVGMGMVMAPSTTVVMGDTPVEQSGMGSGILATIRQTGSVLGISVLGAVLQNQLVTNVREALSQIPQLPAAIRDQIIQGVISGDMGASSASQGQFSAQIAALIRNQYSISVENTMKVTVAIILIGTLASLLISSHIRRSKPTD
jgi:EmrB/QacA subfamily drug resistance transporter